MWFDLFGCVGHQGQSHSVALSDSNRTAEVFSSPHLSLTLCMYMLAVVSLLIINYSKLHRTPPLVIVYTAVFSKGYMKYENDQCSQTLLLTFAVNWNLTPNVLNTVSSFIPEAWLSVCSLDLLHEVRVQTQAKGHIISGCGSSKSNFSTLAI